MRTDKNVQRVYQKGGIYAVGCKRLEWAGRVWRSNGLLKRLLTGKLVNGSCPIDNVGHGIIKSNSPMQNTTIENNVDGRIWRKVGEAAKRASWTVKAGNA